MTMRVLLFVLLCLAGAASAQTVVVRSGDHGTFTRLALDMPSRAVWRMDPRPDGALIIFPQAELDFDITQVFDRIGRNRLRAIKAARGQIHLDFACECGVQAFWHTDRMLVLDIAEAFPSSLMAQRRSSDVSQGEDPSSGMKPFSSATAQLARSLDASLPHLGDTDVTEDPVAVSDDETLDLSDMRATLLRELGRAASQGLLTPTRKPLPDPVHMAASDTPAPETRDTEAPRNEAPVAPEDPRMDDNAHLNLRAQSSIDRAITSIRAESTLIDTQDTCMPMAWLDLPSWGGTGSFHQEIGDLNRQLLGEFDRPDKEIALDLARTYLYFGFGAEARHILDLRAERSDKDALLREMAQIMDRGHAPAGARLATTAGCGEPAVLWALLAMPTVPRETVFDHKALLRSFAALPVPLRDTFGPELARRLIEARHRGTAQNILRMTERTGAPGNSDLALARADLAGVDDDHDTARTELDAAVTSNSVAAAEALVQLIDGLLAKGAPVPLDKAELAGAYAYENRGTDLGRRMTTTYLAALGASGAFEKAVSEFDRLRSDLDATGTEGIATALMQQMTRNADDVTFLRHALSDRLIAPAVVPAALGVDIATRLLGSGLAEQARTFVAADLPGRSGRMSKLTRAEIALVQDRPRQAEVELLGLDGAEANILRAKARSLSGDHTAARILYTASDQTEKAMEAAWFAEDLDQMARANDPLLRQIAETLQNMEQQAQTSSDPPLERHRDLLESAGTLRMAMKRLLDGKDTAIDGEE